MKNRAIVSERGTITIPEAIRERTHIRSGDMMEFVPGKNRIVLKHLIVKRSQEESFMTDNEWGKFDKLVHSQLKNGQYASYSDLNKAKGHSRRLMRKG